MTCRFLVAALVLLAVPVSVPGVEDPAPAPQASEGSRTERARPTDQNDLFRSLSLSSRKEPIRINSDSLELDYKGSTLTYRGSVHVTQGDVTLTSDRLSITYDRDAARRDGKSVENTVPGRGDADKIKEVIAEGSVRIRKGTRLAEGRRAVFDQAKQTIVLSDGAVLHDGPNQVAGDRIVVYLEEERSVVEGGSNSRVKAVFYPGSNNGEDKSATPVQSADAGHDDTPSGVSPQP